MSEINKIRYHGVDYDIGGTGNEIFIGKVEKAPQEAKIIVDGFIATPDTPEKNYEEIYSEEERVIGTWFGKPLYSKSYLLNVPANNVTTNSISLPQNFEKGFIRNGYIIASDGFYPLAYHLRDDLRFDVWLSTSNNSIRCQQNGFASATGYTITINYTKTTD